MLSGLGPVAAFYGAIVVGFFTAVLGGAAPMISGPSAIVTIFTAVIIGTYADDLAEAFTIVMLAGLLQIAFGALRLGPFVNWLPVSVVRGVFVGVGCYIVMSQTLWFLGAPVEPGIGLVAIIASWPQAVTNVNGDALGVALITLAVFIVWPPKLHQVVPNALVALIAGTLAGALWFDAAPRIAEPRIGIPALPALQMPVLISRSVLLDAIQPALILAFLSSIYNLLTALIIDPITGRNHKPNRELVGLGVGNIVAGLIGGLPGAASAPCSLLAARSGGRTAVTGVVCAAVLLAVLFGLGSDLDLDSPRRVRRHPYQGRLGHDGHPLPAAHPPAVCRHRHRDAVNRGALDLRRRDLRYRRRVLHRRNGRTRCARSGRSSIRPCPRRCWTWCSFRRASCRPTPIRSARASGCCRCAAATPSPPCARSCA